MTEISKLSGVDFCGLGEFEVDLLERGLVLVTGENRDTEAAESNGANKSNLLASIPWCLFEKTPMNHRGEDVVRRGKDGVFVEVALSVDGEPFFVRRGRTRGKRHAVVIDGVTGTTLVEEPDDVTRWVENELALDFASFCSTVFYAPGGRFFGDPTATDAERKALLHRVLNTGPMSVAASRARARAAELKSLAAVAREKHAAAVRETERLWMEKAAAEEQHSLHEAEMEEKARGLEHQADDAETLASTAARDAAAARDEVAALVAARVAAEEVVTATTAEVTKATAARDAARVLAEGARKCRDDSWREASAAKAAADKFAAGKCPECGHDVNPGDRSAHAEAAAAKYAEDDSLSAAASKVVDDAIVELNKAIAARNRAGEALKKATEAERAASGRATAAHAAELLVEAKRAYAAEKRAEAAVVRAAPSPWGKIIDDLDARAATATRRSGSAAALAGKAERELSHFEFWTRGFGPEGLPSFMLDEAVPELEEHANGYLRVLADGDISLKTTATSKTKAGDARERLGVSWEIEGVEGAPPSRAQEGKLKLATGLALMDIACARSGQRPSLLLMDEVLDGFDRVGKARVVRLLRELRSRRSTILVVTHEPSMSDAFEHELRVIKSGGVATVEER